MSELSVTGASRGNEEEKEEEEEEEGFIQSLRRELRGGLRARPRYPGVGDGTRRTTVRKTARIAAPDVQYVSQAVNHLSLNKHRLCLP